MLNEYLQRTVPPVLDVSGGALAGVPVAVSAGSYAALATRQGETFFHQVPVDNAAQAQAVTVHVAAEQNPTGAAVAASQQRTALVPRTPETFTHDADGNLTDDAAWHYTWDGENRLFAMETSAGAQAAGIARLRLEFVHDSQGRRLQKKVTTSPLAGLLNVRRDYYPNDTLGGAPASTVYGGNIDDVWFLGGGLPYPTPFSYRVTSALYVPTGGAWTFQIKFAYAGARLYLDNTLVIDVWNGLGMATATVNLAAGQAYTLRYEARFSGGPGGATPVSQLDWSGPQVAQQRVPGGVGAVFNAVTVATRYLYDGWNLLAELDSSGAPVRTYAWGLDLSGGAQGAGGVGGLLMVNDHSPPNAQPSTHFAAFDGNGNVGGLVNASDGTLSAKYDYNAFGETILSDGPFATANPFRYSTKYQDQETGLLYYGYRYLNTSTGRWLSRDPIEEIQDRRVGESSEQQGGPNLYVFVGNNPINWVDPFGLAYFAYRLLDSFAGKLIGVWGSGPGSEDDKKNTVTAHEQIFFEDGKSPGDIGYFGDNTVRPDKSKVKYKPAHSSGWNDCVMRKAVAAVKPKPFCLLEKKGKEKYNCQDFSSAVRSEYQKLIKDPKVLAQCCPTEAEKNK